MFLFFSLVLLLSLISSSLFGLARMTGHLFGLSLFLFMQTHLLSTKTNAKRLTVPVPFLAKPIGPNKKKERMTKASSPCSRAVVAASGLHAADASIESTCRAAARDRLMDVPFCVAQFATYHGAAEADAWGLAKTAALVGVNLSDDAKFDIGSGKVAGGKAAVEACSRAYDAVGMAFAEAADELTARRYAPAKDKLAGVAALARRCDAGFVAVRARTPPALDKYASDCQKMAVIGIAITSLVK
jgi:pectinesterase inhibitor-like protein